MPSLIPASSATTANSAQKVIIRNIVCASGINVGDWVRFNNLGEAVLAQADSNSNAKLLGIVEAKPSSTLCNVLITGVSDVAFVGLDVTKDYYLSATSAGTIQDTPPTSGVILTVGRPVSSTSLYVKIEVRLGLS